MPIPKSKSHAYTVVLSALVGSLGACASLPRTPYAAVNPLRPRSRASPAPAPSPTHSSRPSRRCCRMRRHAIARFPISPCRAEAVTVPTGGHHERMDRRRHPPRIQPRFG